MKKLLFLLFSAPVFAATHAVVPTCANNGDGTTWACAASGGAAGAFNAIPATLTRGDIYYLADGTYPSYTFNQSGTATVELRKAQSYDHGPATGWNTSTMGAAQAVFATYRQLAINSPGLIINGNGTQTTPGCGGAVGSTPTSALTTPTDCGIKIDNSACTGTTANSCSDGISDGGVLSGGWTMEYVEIRGLGNATSENYMIRADGSTGTSISHMYLHNYGSVCVVGNSTTNIVFNLNYIWRNQIVAGSSPAHGQCFEVGVSSSGGTVSNNVFRDIGGTAAMATFNATGTSSNWTFYNNVVWTTPGFTPLFATTDGMVACINSHTCNSLTVVQNSFVNMGNNSSIENEVGGTATVQNNLWYTSGHTPTFGPSGTYTQDHNSFLVSGTSCATGTSNVCDNAASNPFVSWTTGNFNLASDAADWNNRTSLTTPTTDINGKTFTTDRGVAQFIPGTTWYIRPDGGTRWDATVTTGQCDGKHDAAYPGTGTNQPCAFNDVRWLWDNQTFGNYPNWIISGGDTVINRANTGGAPWRVGFTGNGSTTDPWCFGGGGPINCIMPSIPSGTASQHTRFLGENYASCSTTRTIMTVNGPRVQQIPDVTKTTKIYGGHGEYVVVNLTGSNYVDVQCLDISSFQPACQLQGSPQPNPCNRSVPVSDYTSDGIETSNTSGNLLMQDLYVHGTNSRGIHGQQGTGPYTVNRVWISIIPQTGYDFDDGTASGTGAFSLTNSIIECSGCQQLNSPPNYPPLSDAQMWQNVGVAYSQGSGNVIGDGIGTPGNSGFPVTMDSDVFQNNTQDGEDFGHMDTGSFPFTLTNSVSQHNMGQTFKNGWAFNNVKYLNNIALADCDRITAGNQLPGGVPLTVNQYLVDGCRAGDNFSINFQHATQMLTANNTIVGYAPTFFDYKCVDSLNDCSAAVWTINNNIVLAYNNPAAVGQPPADFCGPSCNGGSGNVGTANRTNNIYFNLRNCNANVPTPSVNAGTSTGEQCVSPQFTGQPGSPMGSYNVLDGFNYNLASGSPAIGAGVNYTGMLTTDYAGNTQTNPPVIGALIRAAGAPTLVSIAVTPNPGAVNISATLAMTCTATFSDSSTAPCSSPAWTDTAAHSSINSSTGVVTGVSAGSDTVTATIGSISGHATVNVAGPTLVSMAVTPNPGSVAAGLTLAMTCTATYSDSSTGPCASPVWTDTHAHSTVNSATGVVTGVSIGSDTITATIGSVSGNATVNVTAATLVSMAVTPNPGSVTTSSTLTMTCTSTFTDSSTAPCSSPTWTDTAAHSSVNSSTGVVTGASVGSDTVTATIGGVSGHATVNVSAPSAPPVVTTTNVKLSGTVTLQ